MNRQARPARPEPEASEAPQPEPARLPPPTVTRDEIDLLIRRAGLTLNAGQKADLAVAYQHLVMLAAKLPRNRPFADEPAFAFHPPPPPPPAEAPVRPGGKAASGRAVAHTAAKPPGKPRSSAKPKAKGNAKAKASATARAKAAKRPAKPAARR